MATTRKMARQWMAEALVGLVGICRKFVDGDPDAEDALRRHMHEVALVESATGATLTDAIPARRRRDT